LLENNKLTRALISIAFGLAFAALASQGTATALGCTGCKKPRMSINKHSAKQLTVLP
jgi:hypothetical protein